jgi:hypothetical protein
VRDWGFASLLQVKLSTKASLHRILNCPTGIGGLIGMTLPFFPNFSEIKFELFRNTNRRRIAHVVIYMVAA